MSTRDEATAYAVRALAEIGISENTSLLHNPGINHLKLGNMIRSAYEAGHRSGLAAGGEDHNDRSPRDGDCVAVYFANTVTRKGVFYMYGLQQGTEETDDQFKARVESHALHSAIATEEQYLGAYYDAIEKRMEESFSKLPVEHRNALAKARERIGSDTFYNTGEGSF